MQQLFARILRRLIAAYAGRDFEPISVWETAHAHRLKREERQFYTTLLSAPVTVEAANVSAVMNWLLSCRLLGDAPPADVRGYLREFERTRKEGTAAEHAWWAWRQLIRLGKNPQLVIGRDLADPHGTKRWWVTFDDGGFLHLLNPSTKQRQYMLQPLPNVQDTYRPITGIDSDITACRYVGYLELLREFGDDLEPFTRASGW